MPGTKCKYLCMSLVNMLFLSQYWTRWKPRWGVRMWECFPTLQYQALCVLLCVGLTGCELLFLLGVVGLRYIPKENRWPPEALVNALSSNTKCLRNPQIRNEMHLPMEGKLLGPGWQLEKDLSCWAKVSVKCWLTALCSLFTLSLIVFLSVMKY